MPTDMKLPELGENIEGGDVLRVMVKAGDAIKKDQPVLELETDKATIEVPSSADGVVKEVKVKPGEKVKVGQTIFIVDENGAGASAAAPAEGAVAPKPAEAEKEDAKAEAAPAEAPKADAKTGDTAAAQEAAPAKEAAPASPKPVAAPEPPKAEKRKADVVEMKPPKQAAAQAPAQAGDAASIPAAPSARRLARELGVNIQDIQGSGPGGRISMDDVTAHTRRLLSGAGAARSSAADRRSAARLQQVGRDRA